MLYLLAIAAGVAIGWLLMYKNMARDSYWMGRRDGWFACESLVLERAKEQGAEELIKELLQ